MLFDVNTYPTSLHLTIIAINEYKGCVRYIFTSLFFKSKALVKLGKMFFILLQNIISFSRKSNFRILGFQIS